MKESIRGTGITARKVRELRMDCPEDVSEAKEGFRAYAEAFEAAGNEFSFISRHARSVISAILNDAEHPERAKEDTEVWFAREIQFDFDLADKFISEGDADQAARFSFSAASAWATMVMKYSWEDDALRGEKVAGGSKNAAHQTNSRHDEMRQKRFTRIRQLLAKGLNMYSACATCEAEGLGPASGIKRQWYRFKKNGDT